MKDKVAYSQGEKIIGTMEAVDDVVIYKTTYSDFSVYADSSNRQYLRILSTPNVGDPGTKKYLDSGQYTETMNIPLDILAQYFGITPEKIKQGEIIMGITGTYAGSMS